MQHEIALSVKITCVYHSTKMAWPVNCNLHERRCRWTNPAILVVGVSFDRSLLSFLKQLLKFCFQMVTVWQQPLIVLKDSKLFWKAYTCVSYIFDFIKFYKHFNWKLECIINFKIKRILKNWGIFSGEIWIQKWLILHWHDSLIHWYRDFSQGAFYWIFLRGCDILFNFKILSCFSY